MTKLSAKKTHQDLSISFIKLIKVFRTFFLVFRHTFSNSKILFHFFQRKKEVVKLQKKTEMVLVATCFRLLFSSHSVFLSTWAAWTWKKIVLAFFICCLKANFCLKISKHYQNLLIQSLEKKFLLPGFEWALVFTPQRNPVRLLIGKKHFFWQQVAAKSERKQETCHFLRKKGCYSSQVTGFLWGVNQFWHYSQIY